MAEDAERAAAAMRERFADLTERVGARRDRVAFAELFAYFAPRVKAYVLRLGAEDGIAEEITQDVMALVWRKAALFDRRQAAVSTWIFRIARNRRIDVLRQTQSAPPERVDVLELQPEPLLDDAMDTRDREARVRAAIANLPSEQVDLLRAAYYEGLSHSQIAELAHLPLGTVKTRIRLALSKLRGVLLAERPV